MIYRSSYFNSCNNNNDYSVVWCLVNGNVSWSCCLLWVKKCFREVHYCVKWHKINKNNVLQCHVKSILFVNRTLREVLVNHLHTKTSIYPLMMYIFYSCNILTFSLPKAGHWLLVRYNEMKWCLPLFVRVCRIHTCNTLNGMKPKR